MMPIVFQCTSCNHTLRVPEDVAGKRVKCPQCKQVLRIPEDSEGQPDGADSAGEKQTASTGQLLQLKTRDGSVYGPVSHSEMDRWLAEGRITADCELLDEEGRHWRWATEAYPHLAATAAVPPPPPTPSTTPSTQSPVPVAPVIPTVTPTASAASAAALPNTEIAPLAASDAGSRPPEGWAAGTPSSPFRARVYPAMTLTSKFYRGLGWLLIFVAGIAAFFYAVIIVGGSVVSNQLQGAELAIYLGLSLLGLLGGVVYVAALVITLWFAAEAIRCLMDIEENTHRCSFHLKNLNRRETVE
jgi:phage FluMu protein Com